MGYNNGGLLKQSQQLRDSGHSQQKQRLFQDNISRSPIQCYLYLISSYPWQQNPFKYTLCVPTLNPVQGALFQTTLPDGEGNNQLLNYSQIHIFLQYFQMSSGEHSVGLKAGTTKSNKMTLRGGPTNNLSRRGLGRGKGFTSSKTSQSEKDGDIVVVEGRVRTPKRIITPKYKEMTEEFLKLTGADQQREKKEREDMQQESRNRSSYNSVSESEVRNSSSRVEQGGGSSFVSSSNSQSGSQNESSLHQRQRGRHKSKGLSIQELEQHVSCVLCQTQTIFTLFLPSACHNKDNEEKEKATANYVKYCKERIGSDNYVNSAVETFNFKFKTTKQAVEGSSTVEASVFASNWDISDTIKKEQKTEFDTLQEELKKNSQKEINSFMINPFATLPLDQKAIDIHSRSEIPGAAEYLIKENSKSKEYTKSKVLNTGQTGNMRDDSKSGTGTIQGGDTKKQSSSGTRTKQQKPTAQIQYQIRQQQLKVEEEETTHLKKILQGARSQPSQTEQKIIENPNLATALKYVDIILNNQTYSKQYVMYRNYPELKVKRFDDDAVKKNRKNQEIKQKAEQSKDMLQLLFKFSCKHSEGVAVTSADWNPINKDLLAVSYGDLDIESTRPGYLMFWTLKNPSFPERIITSSSRITTCKFSNDNPNLIAVGTYDGIVAIYDIRKKDSKPIVENREDPQKHSDAIWEIQWISKGKGNDKGESLVSISADGRITQWSMKKGLQCNDLMVLRRIPTGNKKDSTENMNFRFASGLSFQFLSNQASMYLASTEEGVIYRCSKSYTQQFLEVYQGHTGPIYRVRCNPFFPDIFLTCSADWTCKLWNWRRDQPITSFQSLDFTDEVNDIQWSPFSSTLFASACKDGRLQLWDLTKKNMLDPIYAINKGDEQQKYPSKTMIRFSKGAPVLVTGDLNGDVYVYRLNCKVQSQSSDYSVQNQKITKLLYPNGYNKRVGEQTQNPVPLAENQK